MTRHDSEDEGDACGSFCGYCGRCSSGPSRVVAICADCGDEFATVIAELGARCDACWAERDAHTDALEAAALLKRMAKAVLSADLTKVREVS
jgi:predicted amidophosphoribosyltransferase